MTDPMLTQAARAARLQAKEKRVSGASTQELTAAIDQLKESVRALNVELARHAQDSEVYRDLAGEIADCFGVIGGTLRDLGRFEEAVTAYDKGAEWEMTAFKSGGRPNSYCLLQRLVNRILLVPQALAGGQLVVQKQLRPALEEARDEILRQISGHGRGRDPWACADVALVEELLDRVDEAEQSWLTLEELHPPQSVYGSTAAALEPLFRALAAHVPPDRAAAHEELLDWLNEKAGQTRTK